MTKVHQFQFTGKLLGKGTYGKVEEAIDEENGNRIAIKTIENFETFFIETVFNSSLKHPNIPRLLYSGKINDVWILAFPIGERIPNVDYLPNDLLSVVEFLHSVGIYHGDIKESNLIYLNGRIQLIDFGCARLAMNDEHGTPHVTGLNATRSYTDPEFVRDDWNPITSELYAVANTIWNAYAINQSHRSVLDLVYNFSPVESLDALIAALSHYPIKERQTTRQIMEKFNYSIVPGSILTYIPKPYNPDNYREKVKRFLHGCYLITNPQPLSARLVFYALGVFRLIFSFYEYSFDSACLAIAAYLLREPYYNAIDGLNETIFKIVTITQGRLLVENYWDKAQTFEDLVNYLSEFTGRKKIGHGSKYVYFYTVYRASEVIYPFEIINVNKTLSEFVFSINTKLIQLESPKKDESDLAHFYFLHYRHFLPELPVSEAKKIYRALYKRGIGRQILKLIMKYEMPDAYCHPFQITADHIQKWLQTPD